MRVAALLAALGLAAAPLCGGVETRAEGGRVQIEARAAPLSDVLDDVARRTGLKVVYEGPPPRTPVTASVDRDSLLEALLAVLEGLDLTYVIQHDAAGTGAVKLVMLAAGSSRGTSAGRTAAVRQEPPFAEPELGEPDPAEDPTLVMRDRSGPDPATLDAEADTEPALEEDPGLPAPQPEPSPGGP